jgi:hypothetical protein
LETQWYDDQYDDNGVDVNAPGDDDGYVEPLEQTDDFGESAYEYTYHPQDDQEQQPEEYYYPEEMPELIRNTEESSVSEDSENTEPSDEEIENIWFIESLGLKKRNSMSAMSGFKRPEPVEGESDKKKWTSYWR